jgi:hypothetical protein
MLIAGLMLAGCGGGGRFGNCSGYVQDATSQQGVGGASISIGGKSGTTQGDGSYRITGIPVGAQAVTISATDYATHSGQVQVAEGDNVANFTLDRGTMTVTTPNGGEDWRADDTQAVEWQWQARGVVDHVRLQYSPNASTTWRDVIANTPNTGSYTWLVPQAITAKALVRVIAEDASNSSFADDTSNAAFTILPPATGRYLYLRSDAEGSAGSPVTVPIYVTDATGIAGADITLTFGASVLTATGAETTALTNGFTIVTNPTPGQIRISLASATGIASGSGALVNVRFTVSSVAPGTTSQLTLQSTAVYDQNAQAIAHERIDGLFTVR